MAGPIRAAARGKRHRARPAQLECARRPREDLWVFLNSQWVAEPPSRDANDLRARADRSGLPVE